MKQRKVLQNINKVAELQSIALGEIALEISESSITFTCLDNNSKLKPWELKQLWTHAYSKAVGEIMVGRSAAMYVYNPPEDFKLPDSIKGGIRTTALDGVTYYGGSMDSWSKDNVTNIALSMEFEINQLCFHAFKNDNAQENSMEPDKVFEYIYKTEMNESTENDKDFECVCMSSDGEELMWLNPNPFHTELKLSILKDVFHSHGFIFKEKWTKNEQTTCLQIKEKLPKSSENHRQPIMFRISIREIVVAILAYMKLNL